MPATGSLERDNLFSGESIGFRRFFSPAWLSLAVRFPNPQRYKTLVDVGGLAR
jgi:hypothetical protein